jgi:Asp-tRNA(Asn)/Glu-tRNA(Gln) amidotransferase A subunit family amidase
MSAIPMPPLPTGSPFSLVDAVRARTSGNVSPTDLVEQCLGRIRANESAIKAWVEVDEEGAKASAKHLGSLRPAALDSLPLAGVPIAIKDIIDVAGLPTKCGSPIRVNHVADDDAPIVRVLRELGAIVLGKTVTTQFACSDPSVTHNPWNLSHTPGGSSAGSAAATAAGMCFAALGTQTGGSITRPASFCGVASFKGEIHRWPTNRIFPVGANLDHVGPHARTVADLALLWTLIESRLRPDTASIRTAQADAIVADTWLDSVSPPRLSIIEDYFSVTAEPEAYASYMGAIAKLEAAGAIIDEIKLPQSCKGLHASHAVVMAVEGATVHRANYASRPDTYEPKISAMIERGLTLGAVEYRSALEHQAQIRADLELALRPGGTPALALSPASVTSAPPMSENTTGDAQFNAVWSFSGLPTCGVPAALGADGLPVSLQLAAPAESFAHFQAAAWCERVLEFPLLGR